MLVLVNESLRNLHLGKQSRAVQILDLTRLFMLTRLLQIDTLAGTVERDFTLLATTLGADAAVHGEAETLLSPLFADGATQMEAPQPLSHGELSLPEERSPGPARPQKWPFWDL